MEQLTSASMSAPQGEGDRGRSESPVARRRNSEVPVSVEMTTAAEYEKVASSPVPAAQCGKPRQLLQAMEWDQLDSFGLGASSPTSTAVGGGRLPGYCAAHYPLL
jgi:hypothetical protein